MRAEHSSRVGQAWAQVKVWVVDDSRDVSLLPFSHFRCSRCDAVVRIDTRGYAACECCGLIFNDGRLPYRHEKKSSELARRVKRAHYVRFAKRG